MVSQTIHWRRLLLAFPLVIALLVTSSFSVSARPLYYGEDVPAGTIVEADIFLTGNNVVIDGTVAGDVFALGNNIHINGTIEGSLVAVAQTIRINGTVKGTTYAASIAFDLGAGATLERNLYYGGLSFATRKGAVINRDLAAFSLGGTMIGQINGNVKAVIGPYEILKLIFDALKVDIQLPGMIYDEPAIMEATPENLPSVQSTLQPTSASSTPNVQLPGYHLAAMQIGTPTATTQAPASTATLKPVIPTITSQIVASVTSPSGISPVAQTGFVIDWPLVGDWFLGRLRSLVVLVVFCLLGFWSMPGIITRASGKLREKPLASLGTGLVGTLISFNAILAAILVAAIFTAIGFWLVFATVWELGIFIWATCLSLVVLFIILVCIFVFYITKATVAYTLGTLILKRATVKSSWMKILALFSGLIIYVLLAGLPYVGWVIGILATGFGFGSWWLDYRQKREDEKLSFIPPAAPSKKKPMVNPVKKNASRARNKVKKA
jgi:cytoskeletal protein CcmA (bactofilin family)